MLNGVLDNQPGAPRDIVQLNAGAAIYVAGLSNSLCEGIIRAGEVIASGEAKAKLEQLIEFSGQLSSSKKISNC
jgi:anthranilate phosphoribosyltransferase